MSELPFVWKKHGLVFGPSLLSDRPDWMQAFAQAPHVLPSGNVLRVYFNCRPKPDANGQYVSYCAYVDVDPVDMRRIVGYSKVPVLEPGGRGAFDEFGTYPMSVVEFEGRLLAYYGGWTRCESVPFDVAIGCAESFDGGKTFVKMGKGPVLSCSPQEPFILSGPKVRLFNGKLYLYYIAGRVWIDAEGKLEPVYKIRLAVSENGIDWEKKNTDLIGDALSEYEAQASPDVIFSNGKYHMFFCYRQPSDFRRNRERSYRIGYAHSVDGETWQRDDDRAGISISETGFDNEMVAYPHVFTYEGHTWMYYLGNQVGKEGFGLAELMGELK